MKKDSLMKKKKEENMIEIDRKTPKSKFKSVMRKFEKESNMMMKRKKDEKLKMMKNSDEEREKVEVKRTPEKTVSISKNTFGSLGESWKGKDWETPTPSGVKTFRKSAAADARGGQLSNSLRTSNMLGNDRGQYGKLNGKRKFGDISSKEKTFSPTKLPKLNISKKIFLHSG